MEFGMGLPGDEKVYDLIIIGKGPAGISCALYSLRASLDILVIGKDYGNMGYNILDNYYGVEEDLRCIDVAERAENRFKSLGGMVVSDEVVDLDYDGNYVVETESGDKYKSRVIFLALGKYREKLEIDNIDSFEGKGASYCAVCDGFFYRDKEVAVIGNNEYTKKEADFLSKSSSKVYVLTNGKEYSEELFEGYDVITDEIDIFLGDDRLNGISFKSGRELKVDGAFIAINLSANTLKGKLNLKMENGDVVVDDNMKTSVDGIYAGGDMATGVKQISKAVGDGAIASNAIIKTLMRR